MTTLLLLALGCVHAPPAGPPRSATSGYEVAVVAASGERTVTSLYGLDVTHDTGDVWTFATTWSEGTWEEPGQVLAFDSRAPAPGDPWPLVMQHAVSALPTPIVVEDGAPTRLADPAAWREAGLAAVRAVDLPPEALSTGHQLVADPDGVVRDLRRNFPGTPPDGTWTRSETIAGLDAVRTERCAASRTGGETTWTCMGTIEGPSDGPARLHDVTSETTMVVDGRGLVRLETRYAGTMVLLDPAQQQVIDRPVAGRRLVVRR